MNHPARIVHSLAVALTLVAAALAGCKGSTKSGTTYKQLPTRELQAYLNGDVETVHQKAVAVLRDDYGYQITKEAKDATQGKVEAKTARDDTVRVETFKDGEKVTKIQVWVGPIGDETKASQILSKIESSLD